MLANDRSFLDGSQIGILKDRGFLNDSWTGPRISFSKWDFKYYETFLTFL
uniref:Uncharacterized protein n=1 Tax=Rhizophagus irregularis (strain DAOM 181602 / DAOM 197198 / MUCL 43194) TaxID=747089 RepID=U9SR41_RHIID